MLTINFVMAGGMLTLSRQLRAARVLAGWEQAELASKADVAIGTIRRMEAGDGPVRGNAETLRRVQGALEAAGVEFIAENGGGPGVRLKKRSK
jgi:transcriptional regulator with XRE-family HTH domain